MQLSQNALIKRTDRVVGRVVDTVKTMNHVNARMEVAQTVVTVERMVKSAI